MTFPESRTALRYLAPYDFMLVCMLALTLYLPLRSIQWDINGIIEAQAVEVGEPQQLLSPNHLLYRPLGYALLGVSRSLGYVGPSIELLQILTAVCAALGVGMYYSAMRDMTGDVRVATLATLLLGTSWSYWRFSTDAYYITLAAAAVVSALLVLFSRSVPSRKRLLLAIVAVSISVLFWQANVFLIPWFSIAFAVRTQSEGRNRIAVGISFLASVAILLAFVYVSAAAVQGIPLDPSHLSGWLTTHTVSGGGISLWGRWSIDRIPAAAATELASLVPVWDGLGLRDLVRGVLRLDKVASLASLVAWGAILLITLVYVIRRRYSPSLRSNAILLLVGYLVLLPFIVWWDPYEPKWFVVPNLFLLATLAAIWSSTGFRTALMAMMICAFVAAGVIWQASILPRHLKPNPSMELARCFAQHAGPIDAVAVADWTWFTYASYWFAYQGESVYLVGDNEKREDKLARVRNQIYRTNQRGGRVYARDLRSLADADLALTESLSGLTQADFDTFSPRLAFDCGSNRFVELTVSGTNSGG